MFSEMLMYRPDQQPAHFRANVGRAEDKMCEDDDDVSAYVQL